MQRVSVNAFLEQQGDYIFQNLPGLHPTMQEGVCHLLANIYLLSKTQEFFCKFVISFAIPQKWTYKWINCWII